MLYARLVVSLCGDVGSADLFYFVRHNGKLTVRHETGTKALDFRHYFPCFNPSVDDRWCLTETEHAIFQEVWKFCEEHGMNQQFFVNPYNGDWGGVVVEVMVDPEHEALFKLRWA